MNKPHIRTIRSSATAATTRLELQRHRTGPFTMTAPGVLPRTVQLCVHCQQRPAGFWVRRTGGAVVRRPWCLPCCQELDQDRYDVIPFGG